MVTLQLRQLVVPPGNWVLFHDVNWQEFEAILEELGEKRASRLAYFKGNLEIRVPLPEHEKAKVIIGDLVKFLLDECDRNWEPLGSTTFKREDMLAGIEPDECFYIQNYSQMIGKTSIDLRVDPPPDLAIEINVTSKTQIRAYQALGVPEIWQYETGKIHIYLLQSGKYVEFSNSPIFPKFPIIEEISRFLEISQTIGTSRALREFRLWVRENKSLIK
ncbi:MAG: Uma2 family endonuclease [Phormidium sp.]